MSTPPGAVAVLGAGGHGKIVIAALRAADREVAGVFDDDPARVGARVLGVPVVGGAADLLRAGHGAAVIGIAANAVRERIAGALPGVTWVAVVHPRAYVDPSATLGEGAFVAAGAVVQADAVIGAHSIVNTGATVDHDCVIDDFVHVAPGAHLAGGVRVDRGAFVGIGATVIQYRSVGAWSVIGAGGAVVRDIPPRVTAVGVPARWAGGRGD